MKKASKFAVKLDIKKKYITLLTSQASNSVLAGDDETGTRRNSYNCIPPFNAPPYFYPDKP
ncbi:hypothetical protein DFQ12_2657 [Sphingobacterium detergens]|uniref:Uncharacterized protein n=1 Tax=Sphingobacterium detergens TaxID=1145106 RepID=A0A420B6V2_SPHD1|nr:hypothetical protein DFQ12_2657 [Sphingobacterium detergens]